MSSDKWNNDKMGRRTKNLKPRQYLPIEEYYRQPSKSSLAGLCPLMKITDLPDDCFFTIFEQFTIRRLIKLRKVCTRFQAIIETQITPRRKSLKLFYNLSEVYRYGRDLLGMWFGLENIVLDL